MKVENDYRLLKEIIERLLTETKELKEEIKKEKGEDRIFKEGVFLGYGNALTAIQDVISTWHPHDTDEELAEIYEAFGINCDVDNL